MTVTDTGTAERPATQHPAPQHAIVATRLGDLTVVRAGDQLTGLYFPRHWGRPDPARFGVRVSRGFEDAARQLGEYLAGGRQRFDLPLAPRGTDLELGVWALVAQVPYGGTTTYGDLARRLGGGVTPQAVGAAVGANPLCILIPCHRVIGSTGKLTGYAGGLRRKRELLDLEQGADVLQDQPPHPARVLLGQQAGHQAAHGVPDKIRLVQAEGVQEGRVVCSLVTGVGEISSRG